jgi:hypothetical protein
MGIKFTFGHFHDGGDMLLINAPIHFRLYPSYLCCEPPQFLIVHDIFLGPFFTMPDIFRLIPTITHKLRDPRIPSLQRLHRLHRVFNLEIVILNQIFIILDQRSHFYNFGRHPLLCFINSSLDHQFHFFQ